MIKNLISMFKNKEIRNKILFTLAMLFIFRFGSGIPVPGIDTNALMQGISDNSLIGMMNLLGGGAMEKFSVFSLGVGPYITASIIIQLLAMDVIPALTEMAKNGQQGRMQMDKITRYLAIVLAFVQAYTLTYSFDISYGIVANPSVSTYLFVATILAAGTSFLVWLGDRVSQFGMGNGISMIIFAGIVANLPWQFISAFKTLVDTTSGAAAFSGVVEFAIFVVMYIAIIVLVIFMNEAVRKIPIQYTSSGVRQGKSVNYLPLKINSASVMPVIFASSVMVAPVTIMSFFESNKVTETITNVLNFSKPLGLTIYVVLVVLFTFFYTNLQVDPKRIADNLNKQGTYILGIRPGSETVTYVSKVLNRITVLGAMFLAVIAALPYLLPMFTNIPSSISMGGTGIIIVVGVALETVKDLESQLSQKAYRGFVKR